jgi:hypothetical protein
MYVGGRLQHVASQANRLYYLSGRDARNTLNHLGHYDWMRFTNLKMFLCGRAVSHWGNRLDVENLEVYDSRRGAELFGASSLSHSLIVAHTANASPDPLGGFMREGFQFYDTWTQSVVVNVTFRNFSIQSDRALSALTFSDTFKPQGISATRQLRFENSLESQLYHPTQDTGSAWMFNFVDFDGTATGRGVPALVGSHIEWWRLGPDCEFRTAWNVWICDKTAQRAVANIQIEVPGITR